MSKQVKKGHPQQESVVPDKRFGQPDWTPTEPTNLRT